MLLTLSAATPLAAQSRLTPLPLNDPKIERRWALPGDPHGLAIGRDGTVYVGLAKPQAVVAIDPESGTVEHRLVLDSAEIASTKELVTLRTNRAGTRLYIANGSDESATILSLPDMTILREITIEGQAIRDALPDPAGRYLFLLGRRVHVYDAAGQTELHALNFEDPMAIAVSADGALLAVIGPQRSGGAETTVVALFDTSNFAEIARAPLQTGERIQAASFAADDRALMAVSRDTLFEKRFVAKEGMTRSLAERICLPDGSGPQILALATQRVLLFAERRCNSSAPFAGSAHLVAPASLYGVDAYALAYDREHHRLLATERSGSLTIYRVPQVAIVH
ncbi:MAG TPA: hypothetical protein VKH35_15710 [Thermoanaerobaculia bacterium]|nr:hypothetical protein [Thermoanaerobaculia bacterium]